MYGGTGNPGDSTRYPTFTVTYGDIYPHCTSSSISNGSRTYVRGSVSPEIDECAAHSEHFAISLLRLLTSDTLLSQFLVTDVVVRVPQDSSNVYTKFPAQM